jgi:large subunit ribosomal protein L2
MGKRIIVQRRGKGSKTYRVNKKAFKFKIQIPPRISGEGTVVELFNSKAHSSPLAKIEYIKEGKKDHFYIPAFKGMVENQKIELDSKEVKFGNIMRVGNIPVKKEIYCVESRPGDGGKFMKAAGSSAVIGRLIGDSVVLTFPSKKEKKLNKNCRAIIGEIAGTGRLDKPIVKAGKQYYMKKSKSKLWPRTSASKMNAIDHPFGSGRGKVPKPRIAKRNSAPGQKVGLLRPRRTGKKK